MPYRIRPARPRDAAALLAVYAPYVLDTTVSFEVEVPSVADFTARIERTLRDYAYLVLEDLGREGHGEREGHADHANVVGYAYYDAFHPRAAYQWAAETSIYLAPQACGRGLGRELMRCLEALMAAQHITMAEACITADNTASIAFHEKLGYTRCATFTSCAFKRGAWQDVVWLSKQIAPLATPPEPLVPLDAAERDRIIAQANARLAERAAALQEGGGDSTGYQR